MKKCALAIGVLLWFAIAVRVEASILVPGAPPVSLDPITGLPAGSIVSNGGSVTVEPFTSLFHGHVSLAGTLYLAVYQEAATGFLDFLFQLKSSKISQDAIMRETLVDFRPAAGFVDAAYIRSGGTVPPGFLSLKSEVVPTGASLSSDGSTVGINFGHGERGLGPASTTVLFMIRTHVRGFRAGTTNIISRETNNILPSLALASATAATFAKSNGGRTKQSRSASGSSVLIAWSMRSACSDLNRR
jgi:hypothetical protein